MSRAIDIDIARERDDALLLDEFNGDGPKFPLARKIDPDYEHDREMEERGE